jgi:hypothetical protein
MPEINLPGGYRPEEGKGPGDEVKALMTIKISDDGTKATILDIDGAKFEGYPEPGEKEEKVEAESTSDDGDSSQEAFGNRLQAAMSQIRGGQGAAPMM